MNLAVICLAAVMEEKEKIMDRREGWRGAILAGLGWIVMLFLFAVALFS